MKRIGTIGLCAAALLVGGRAADAATIRVNAGGNLQAALNAAKPGDTILLQAGATFSGNFILPAKNGTSYITLRSSTPDSELPAAGHRITPAYASKLPKIKVTSAGGSALMTAVAASYWRIMFVEFLPGATGAADLVAFGRTGSKQNTLSQVPHHLIMDRCYLHGTSSAGQRRGLALNSANTQVINSYFSDFKGINQDTQAIASWNGPGPFLIENNYLEGAAENLLFGGSDPSIPNLVPSNITIRHNRITKPLKWMSESWVVKNLIEFKNAANVVVEGNTIENNWAAGQQGYSILFTPRNQTGKAPWAVVKNITVRNNIIRNVSAVFNITGYDNLQTSQRTSGIVIRNNLVYKVSKSMSTASHPANGWFAVIVGGPKNITFDHNTVDNDGTTIILFDKGYAPSGFQVPGLVIKNNLFRDNKYGIFGSNSAQGTATLTMYAPNAYFQANSIGGAPARSYPTGNDYPTLSQWLADFVNRSQAQYQLVSTSISNNGATDGTDIGVDFAALNTAMSGPGAAAPDPGSDPGPDPTPPPPSGGSTPYSGTPAPIPGTIQFENFDKGGEGVAYHDTSSGNSGGVYRSSNVDIQAARDTDGGYDVGWTHAGEWLKYTVNITKASTYTFDIRLAQDGSGASFHILVDGSNATGTVVAPDTGGWHVWKTISSRRFTLSSGTHVIKVIMDADGTGGSGPNLNWFAAKEAPVTTTASMPYSGTPVAMPGTVQFEKFDKGGEAVAYHDGTSGNSGGAYRSSNVDIQAARDTDGGYNVGWVHAGEWLKYTVKVATAKTYAFAVRVAQNGSGGAFHIEVDGVNKSGSMKLPNTGGWHIWQTITKAGIALSTGTHVVRMVMDADGSGGSVANFNWFSVK